MTAMFDTQPRAPEELTSGADRFHCKPYKCVIFAKTCVERQLLVRQGMHRIEFHHCANCELGRTVEAKAGATVDTAKVLELTQRQRGHRESSARAGRRRSRHAPAIVDEELSAQAEKCPAPADPIREEKRTMADTCTHPGCETQLRSSSEPRPAGTETLCRKHRLEFLGDAGDGGDKKAKPNGHSKRAKGKAPHRNGASSADVSIARALEAHELVDLMGWDVARAVASAISAKRLA